MRGVIQGAGRIGIAMQTCVIVWFARKGEGDVGQGMWWRPSEGSTYNDDPPRARFGKFTAGSTSVQPKLVVLCSVARACGGLCGPPVCPYSAVCTESSMAWERNQREVQSNVMCKATFPPSEYDMLGRGSERGLLADDVCGLRREVENGNK